MGDPRTAILENLNLAWVMEFHPLISIACVFYHCPETLEQLGQDLIGRLGGVARPSGHMTHSILFFHEGMFTVHSWDGLLQAGTVDENDDMAAVQRTMFYNRGNPETIMAPSCLCSLF